MQLQQEYWRPEQVAERLNLSVDTVYRLIRRGDLQAFRAGRRFTVSTQALTEFLEGAEIEDVDRAFSRSIELAKLYLFKAVSEGQDAYFDLAEAKLCRAIALRPMDPVPRYELVRLLLRRGHEDQASQAFGELEAAQAKALEARRRQLRADAV